MDSATKMRSKGGKARAKLAKDVLVAIARKGGEARAVALNADQRSAAARKAVNARWDRYRKQKRKGKGRQAGACRTENSRARVVKNLPTLPSSQKESL